ncbi:hypothetical protein [Corynebacterium auriscanis]|uniref:hypothetical protein n=1 Tax=Corynebacterium auriscanis TaxID=99807 RepID=UPI003CF77C81
MNIRKVALAIATASSVALAGTTVASAEEAPMSDFNTTGSISNDQTNTGAGSSQDDANINARSSKTNPPQAGDAAGSDFLAHIGNALGADSALNAADIFGFEVKKDAPAWGPLLHVALIAGVIGSIASVIIGIGNVLKHEGIIR